MSKKEKLDIIYEDKNLIVINKPSGLLTISTEKEKEKTLFHKVLLYEKKKNKNNRIFIVHRLDKDTSGIVIFAKNQKMKNLLQNSWNEIVKLREYVAVVEGIPEQKESTLTNWITENKNLLMYITNKSHDSKLAITKYKVITNNNLFSLLKVEIKTGRKNQIRLQLKNIGNPIVGDKKYGSKVNPIRRLGLHSNKLVIVNPITKKEQTFECDVPNCFVNMFK